MDQDIKQEFEKINHEFEELARMAAEGFQGIEERMATKDDLKALENKMDEGFLSLRLELSAIKHDIARLEEKIDRLAKTETDSCMYHIRKTKTASGATAVQVGGKSLLF